MRVCRVTHVQSVDFSLNSAFVCVFADVERPKKQGCVDVHRRVGNVLSGTYTPTEPELVQFELFIESCPVVCQKAVDIEILDIGSIVRLVAMDAPVIANHTCALWD